MKNILLFLFIFSTCVGYAQDENMTDAKGRKQGLWKKYHPNGVPRYIGNFKDDKPVGVFKYYYDTGKIQAKMTHFGNVSYSNVYYETGELKATGKYENQEKDSIWMYYDLDGHTMAEEFYLSGKREGSWKIYFPNGKIAEEKNYTNNVEDGDWKQYFENGKVKMTATYIEGALEGRATYYDAGGKKAISGKFYHDVRDGYWTYYEKDGITVKKKEQYEKGKRIDANKDDVIEDPNDIEKESEDILNPDNFMSPR